MNAITSANKRIRNNNARQMINKISESNGISYSFMARQLEVTPSNFSHWKSGRYEYSTDKLIQVESIIKKYSFNS